MGRTGAGTTHGLAVSGLCDRSGAGSRGFQRRAPALPAPAAAANSAHRISHRATARPAAHEAAPLGPSTVGPLKLRWRAMVLRILEHLYWSVTVLGSLVLFLALGGFVPVLRRLAPQRDRRLGRRGRGPSGGVWFRVETRDPDSDLGPVLARVDAPLLFTSIDKVARRLGVRPPGQVRLTYLPCCGVVAWGRSQALIIGLPLLRVLTQGELRAVLAHELAHLARGDATRRGPLGPVRRGARAGRRGGGTTRACGPARGLGPVLPARGRPG